MGREKKPENVQLGAAIERARGAAGLTQEDLAELVGVKQQSVGGWETGESAPSAGRLKKLFELLPTLRSELFGHADSASTGSYMLREEPGAYNARPSATVEASTRGVPIVGTVRAGPDRHYLELEYPTGHGDGRVGFHSRDRNAYAVRVEGESMMPRIRPGEFVIVEPSSPYHPGDDVIVSTRAGQKMVKQFLYERDGQIVLDSINSVYERITLPREQVESIHYIVAITKKGTKELEL